MSHIMMHSRRGFGCNGQENASDAEAIKVFAERELVNAMLDVNKCPDFVVNRRHYFGSDNFQGEPGLSDADKFALIEFLKTM